MRKKRKKVSMWQIICLCLPAVTMSERQRFFALFSNMLRANGREPGTMDLGLFFLHILSPEEALTVLEERLDLVVRSQALLGQPPEQGPVQDVIQTAIDDHMRTLLDAERTWLKRTIIRLREASASRHQEKTESIFLLADTNNYPQISDQ
jgi:hypothetical protein